MLDVSFGIGDKNVFFLDWSSVPFLFTLLIVCFISVSWVFSSFVFYVGQNYIKVQILIHPKMLITSVLGWVMG